MCFKVPSFILVKVRSWLCYVEEAMDRKPIFIFKLQFHQGTPLSESLNSFNAYGHPHIIKFTDDNEDITPQYFIGIVSIIVFITVLHWCRTISVM